MYQIQQLLIPKISIMQNQPCLDKVRNNAPKRVQFLMAFLKRLEHCYGLRKGFIGFFGPNRKQIIRIWE